MPAMNGATFAIQHGKLLAEFEREWLYVWAQEMDASLANGSAAPFYELKQRRQGLEWGYVLYAKVMLGASQEEAEHIFQDFHSNWDIKRQMQEESSP